MHTFQNNLDHIKIITIILSNYVTWTKLELILYGIIIPLNKRKQNIEINIFGRHFISLHSYKYIKDYFSEDKYYRLVKGLEFVKVNMLLTY